MENFSDQLNELKILLSSWTNSDKSSAYSTLLHLQEQSITDSSLIQSLAGSSPALLSSILIDISSDDEEIAAQALKCLGFMIYHPSIVGAISGEDAYRVIDSLEKVIITTKIKSVCNLGVWCISIQQLNASYLEAHFDSLLRAVVHALDNPIGSLSTTFEAIQAVMKLATQLNEKMRETSNIWAPPIYRRLISTDKREKDMAERCLLKIRPTMCPPTAALSKVLATDMKRKFLSAMKELLNQGMKIQALQAWGWFIRLMGPYALKNKHLVNELLKIPEQTFSDSDPQVQTASQVAWEGLVEALINPPTLDSDTNTDMEHRNKEMRTSEALNSELEANGIAKSIKLIMTPLIGIMSSKCDPSVHSSCLNTWSYLLHKLDIFVNCSAVRRTVLEPILEVVFRAGPHGRNLWSWNFCLDLLDDLALARNEDPSIEVTNPASDQPLAKAPTIMRKHYPIKWMAWDISQLDFYIRMIQNLTSHGFLAGVSSEIKTLACNAAFRIYQSALVGVQVELKRCSISHNEVMLCLNTIVTFLKKICEDADSDGDAGNDMCQTSLRFIEFTIEELESSTLGSPLYKLMIDVKYVDNSEQDNEFLQAKGLSFFSKDETNMVSPVVYLTILYFRAMLQLTSNVPRMSRYVRLLLSSYEVPDILHPLIGLLYKSLASNCLNIWMAVATCLKDYLEGIKDLSAWKTEFDNTGYHVVSHLLSYPFVLFARRMTQMKTIRFLEPSPLLLESSQNKLELGDIAEVWKSLYVSVNHKLGLEYSTSKNFSEDLSSKLSDCMDEYISMLVPGSVFTPTEKTQECDVASLCGDVAICLVEQILTSHLSREGSKNKDSSGGFRRISCIENSLGFVTRFLRLSCMKAVTNTPTVHDVTSRVFSILVQFIDSLRSSEDIMPFVEIISSPLVEWLSNVDLQNESTSCELQQLWVHTLNCLQKSWPPVNFNSSLLKLQAPLLEATLDHPNPSISKPTITFWNSTYGEQFKLDYPQCLLPVLDKLSRNGKINLCKRNQQYKVSATLNRCSKRVELVDGNGKCSGLKRKRPELTEHQREVRRAQQGRSLDCEGRGPGIRTYTSVDFSQGNEESQDSQDIRNVDSILEMLKRDG